MKGRTDGSADFDGRHPHGELGNVAARESSVDTMSHAEETIQWVLAHLPNGKSKDRKGRRHLSNADSYSQKRATQRRQRKLSEGKSSLPPRLLSTSKICTMTTATRRQERQR